MDKIPFELILLLVAALIGGLNKLMEKLKEIREKSAEELQRREQRAGVDLAEPPVEKPRPTAKRRRPEPRERAPLPIPEFNVPLPIPEVLAPRPPKPEPELAVRRPRPRRTLQLGGEPVVRPLPLPRPQVRQPPAPIRAEVVRAKVAAELADPARVRQAIVLREVLGPPVALRHRWRR